MSTYYTIHDMPHPDSSIMRLVAICYREDQSNICYNRIVEHGMGMRYIVLERVDTNNIGLIVARVILKETWVK